MSLLILSVVLYSRKVKLTDEFTDESNSFVLILSRSFMDIYKIITANNLKCPILDSFDNNSYNVPQKISNKKRYFQFFFFVVCKIINLFQPKKRNIVL